MPTMKLSKTFSVNCSESGPQTNCFGYTAFDTTQKVVVMSFRGTDGNVQLVDEMLSFFTGKKPFFDDAGHIFTYFYDAFFFLWNGGLSQEIRTLKYQYPGYELWVNGHSLGGAIASIAASYVVHSGLYDASKVKLVTMGQPRTGDYEYAMWHDRTFPYSFRIVHHRDIVPHIPPQYGVDELFHHRTEIWYDNNMTSTDPFHICAEADGLYCSNRQLETSSPDHVTYFDMNMPVWGSAGCRKL
uniref:Lipase_3 domain-containing protein n=1 Tax=Caenorhabditis japonica TaxID=281687 RepID=A0A8R1HVM9_CAEJA